MKRDSLIGNPLFVKSDVAARPEACNRWDLAHWVVRGGAIPNRLADHLRHCPGCAASVRHVSRLHASMLLLQTQPLPANLHARSNGRALRMLRRAARASAAASRLLRMRPSLSRWQQAQLHITRAACGAVAALMVLTVRTGILCGIEETREVGQTLAALHWDRHIDPAREWINPKT